MFNTITEQPLRHTHIPPKCRSSAISPSQQQLQLSSSKHTTPLNNIAECAHRTKIGGFLERCRYCNKRIAKNSDIFMYSDLCAFCSVECRDRQINLDKLAGKKLSN